MCVSGWYARHGLKDTGVYDSRAARDAHVPGWVLQEAVAAIQWADLALQAQSLEPAPYSLLLLPSPDDALWPGLPTAGPLAAFQPAWSASRVLLGHAIDCYTSMSNM